MRDGGVASPSWRWTVSRAGARWSGSSAQDRLPWPSQTLQGAPPQVRHGERSEGTRATWVVGQAERPKGAGASKSIRRVADFEVTSAAPSAVNKRRCLCLGTSKGEEMIARAAAQEKL